MSEENPQLKQNLAALDAILAARKVGQTPNVKEIMAEAVEKNPQPGQKMPDGTIYLGKYTPKDRDGNSLSKTFNVFAAPKDLPRTMKYADTVKYISKLKKWCGYGGANHATDEDLYDAIKDNRYNGGWVIPTRDILRGRDVNDEQTMSDSLRTRKDDDTLRHSFGWAAAKDPIDFPDWYWSSTKFRDGSTYVHSFNLGQDHDGGCDSKDRYYRLACRPVRLVEVKP